MTDERSTGTGVGSGAVVPDVVDVDPELEVDGAPPPLLVALVAVVELEPPDEVAVDESPEERQPGAINRRRTIDMPARWRLANTEWHDDVDATGA